MVLCNSIGPDDVCQEMREYEFSRLLLVLMWIWGEFPKLLFHPDSIMPKGSLSKSMSSNKKFVLKSAATYSIWVIFYTRRSGLPNWSTLGIWNKNYRLKFIFKRFSCICHGTIWSLVSTIITLIVLPLVNSGIGNIWNGPCMLLCMSLAHVCA